MTAKRKQQQQNFLSYLWNEFLFARQFEYETPLTPDEVGDVLSEQTSGKLRKANWHRSGIRNDVTITGTGDKQRDFTMHSIMTPSAWTGNTVSARAIGSIEADRERGVTVVRGKATFGRVHHMILTGGALLVGLLFLSNLGTSDVWDNLLWLFIIIVYWFQAYSDRNKLAQRIDETIMNAKASSAEEHLQEAGAVTPVQASHLDEANNEQYL